MRYLLDTNVVSDFVRGHAAVQGRLRSVPPNDVSVSSVTVMEVAYGMALSPKRARVLRPIVDALLGSIELLPFTVEDGHAAGAVRAALRRRGRPIGPYDALLAGCALARGLVFVTGNTDEFARVTGLLIENWRD